MTYAEWEQLAGREVTIDRQSVQLGKLLGTGGSGAVFDLSDSETYGQVIKVLDPDSPIMRQELISIQKYRSKMRFEMALMKFFSWNGTLTVDGRTYPCYLMQKGKSLADAVKSHEAWLDDPQEALRLLAFLVHGIYALRNAGLSHGDIKAENVLLVTYHDMQFYMLADYGTVSESETAAKSNHAYCCDDEEGKSKLEKRIAYDLFCLYQVFCSVYQIEDSVIPETFDPCLRKMLRIMRNRNVLAFMRLNELMKLIDDEKNSYRLPNYSYAVPVSFFMDAVPSYKLEEGFPFDTIMKWNGHSILRDKNAAPGEPFDPLLLMKIPVGHYEKVHDILVACNRLHCFVMPIARYTDNNANEYVLIHAPDDKRKFRFSKKMPEDLIKMRIQDAEGEPLTLDKMGPATKKLQMDSFTRFFDDIEFTPKDIWHLDGLWKLNLFSCDFSTPSEKTATKQL